MKRLLLPLFVTLGLALLMIAPACTSDKTENKEEATPVATVLQVNDVLDNAETYLGTPIVIEGVCTHLCAHGARKMFVMGSDDAHVLRVESNDEIGAFSQDAPNSLVRVEGRLVETRIDEAYLQQWEEKAKEQQQKQHGEKGQDACEASMKANAEKPTNSVAERIANFRKRIQERQASEGKAYVSLYHMAATSYQIVED